MDFVAENVDKIAGNVSFDDVPGNLIPDILTAFVRGKEPVGDAAPEDDLKFMRVGELRMAVHRRQQGGQIALLIENSASNESDAE